MMEKTPLTPGLVFVCVNNNNNNNNSSAAGRW